MANLWQPSLVQATDDNGDPISGAKFYFFEANTTTPATTYNSVAGNSAHAHPVVADGDGRFAPIYLNPTASYDVELRDAAGVLIYAVYDVAGTDEGMIASAAADASADAAAAAASASAAAASETAAAASASAAASAAGETKTIAHVVDDLRAGTPAQIDWFGDSTTVGISGTTGVAVALPPPAALQEVVRAYFNNTSLTVNNKGASGGTATKCLTGTDMFSDTFEEALDASSARIVLIDFGVNDAEGVSATTAEAFKDSLGQMVDITRAHDMVPVLVTPFPCLTQGTNGSVQRAERTKYFADTVRAVARAKGVHLYDKFVLIEKIFAAGKYRPVELVPDGVHPTTVLYKIGGYSAATVLIGQLTPLSRRSQFSIPDMGNAQGDGLQFTYATASRTGVNASTADAAARKLRLLAYVDEVGLDLCMAYNIWDAGSTTACTVSVDGTSVGSVVMGNTNYPSASDFVHDYEICVAENVDPGLHLISITSGDRAVSTNYLRVRERTKWTDTRWSTNATAAERRLIFPSLVVTASGAEAYRMYDEVPTPRLLHSVDLEFTANLAATGEGMFINGLLHGPYNGASAPRYGVLLYLNSSGFLTVLQSTGPSSNTTNVLGSADLRGVSHTYRLNVKSHTDGSNPDQVIAYVDGTAIGSAFTLTKVQPGGWLGAWRSGAGTTTFTNVSLIFG